jgi:hypothetical protein
LRNSALKGFPWRWALWWILVPNLAFILMWPIGGPSMAAPMLGGGLLAVLFSGSTNRSARMLVVTIMFALSLLGYIALSFNLSMNTMFSSVQFLPDLNPLESPEYLIFACLMVVSLSLLIARATKAPPLVRRDHKILALGLIALLINVDSIATAGTRGSYKMSAPAGAPMDSGMIQNNLIPGAISARNLVVILVESWGEPGNREDRAIFDKLWNPQRWSARYDVKMGSSAYFGSTTNAEMREWCGVWADYKSFDFDHSNCLPKQFHDAGYKTIALHSFEGSFFDRHDWYPKIGFDEAMFRPDLIKFGAAPCDGVFPGACDRDVPGLIGRLLRKEPDQRKLIYWLTVNGHLPLPSNPSLATDKCTLGSQQWRENYAMLCRSYEVQRQIVESLTDEIMRPDFPDTDILIVGDHMPPFFPRYLRTRFDAQHVPWVMLRSRGNEADTRIANAKATL